MPRNPYINALAATAYIVGIVLLLSFGPMLMPGKDTIFIPMAMLSLLVLSVALMAYLFFYHPVMLFLEGNKKGAVDYFLKTVAIFGATTFIIFVISAVLGAQSNPSPIVTQMPFSDGAEGSIVGDNLVLGTDGNQTMGAYLIAYNGMTLYTTTKDTGSTSTCYDQCAVNWPPYLIGANDNIANIKAGVVGKVDTIVRTDGGIQVTHNGKPLYFYKEDKQSGDVKGHDIGGVWKVVTP